MTRLVLHLTFPQKDPKNSFPRFSVHSLVAVSTNFNILTKKMDEPGSPSLCELESIQSNTGSYLLSPFLNQKICLMQSHTEEQDLSILECTGMTPTFSSPIPNLTVRAPSFSQSGPFASPFAMASPFGKASPCGKVSSFGKPSSFQSCGRGTPIGTIKEGTPVTLTPSQLVNAGLIMVSDSVMFGCYDDINADSKEDDGICDEDIDGYCSYDSDDSDHATDNALSLIDEEEENAVFAEYGYKKYVFTRCLPTNVTHSVLYAFHVQIAEN